MGASDGDRVEKLDGAEPGRQDDHVVLVVLAVLHLDPGLCDPFDLVRLERGLRVRDGRVVVIGDDDALTPWVVVRGEFGPEFRLVGDLALHHVGAEGAQHVGEGGVAVGDGVVEGLAEVHHSCAHAPADGREVAVQCAFPV